MRALLALSLSFVASSALAADTTPFYPMAVPGGTVAPIRMAVTTTPKQYAVIMPPGATSFRFVNPCNVDVRLAKAADANDVVTVDKGRLFLARTVEIMASVNPSWVSVMAMSDPGSAICTVEMQYGTGN